MMTVPDAMDAAKQHLVTVLPEFRTANLQLEELETPPFRSNWSFTFSITPAVSTAINDSPMGVVRSRRITKSVDIDSSTGDLLSIKNAAI